MANDPSTRPFEEKIGCDQQARSPSGRTTLRRTTRVISVNHREVPAGLVVDEVLGFRRFMDHEFSGEAPETVVRCDRFLAGTYQRGDDTWPVFNLFDLVESNMFLQASAE